ncbi:MAG TPA: hypothetical protein VLV54_20780, partial [Thermoanaerobaculia bacterium]|nr:hypothetical protein [Thermoanaerobaculia bacterium]
MEDVYGPLVITKSRIDSPLERPKLDLVDAASSIREMAGVNDPKLLGLPKMPGVDQEKDEVVRSGAGKVWVGTVFNQGQALFEKADALGEVTCIASIKSHLDNRPACKMKRLMPVVEIENPQEQLRSPPELPAIGGEGPFKLQKANFERHITTAMLEESAGLCQSVARFVETVRYSVSVSKLCMSARLIVGDLIRTVAL